MAIVLDCDVKLVNHPRYSPSLAAIVDLNTGSFSWCEAALFRQLSFKIFDAHSCIICFAVVTPKTAYELFRILSSYTDLVSGL